MDKTTDGDPQQVAWRLESKDATGCRKKPHTRISPATTPKT
jgi:hypothetical protein